MSRLHKLLILAAIVPTVAFGQSAVQLAPLPTGSSLSGVSFPTPDVGWIAGAVHTVYKTTDHGATWTKVNMPGYASDPFYNVTFVTPQLGFIFGNSSTVSVDAYRTTDGGATWEVMADVPFGSWYHMKFVNQTTGFMGANGAMVRTTDGGQTWELRSLYPDCPIMYGMDFLDANVGLAGGTQESSGLGGIFKTTDGGLTWRNTRQSWGSNDAIFLTSSIALADEGVNILRSFDAGETWFPIATVPTGLMDMQRVDANTVVGVSAGGDVWRSADGGFTWSQRWVGVSDLPSDWAVSFTDSLNGHVVGLGGTILATRDGGITWNWLNRGMSFSWNGIVTFSDNDILLAGYHGAVQATNDAGVTWNPHMIDPPVFGRDTELSDIAVCGATSAVACGHWGGLFKTFDKGANWTDLSSSLNPSFYPMAITFTDANNGWITGFDYNSGPKLFLRHTQDGGLSWQEASLNSPGVDIKFIGQTGYLLTSSHYLYKTIDGGANWTEKSVSAAGESAYQHTHMAWVDANTGYVAGWDGFFARTADGGNTWTRVLPSRGGFMYMDVLLRGTNEVWVCGGTNGGGSAVVMRSLDNGATWRTWSIPGQYETPLRMGMTSHAVYVGTWYGSVWKFDLNAQISGTVSLGNFAGPVAGTQVTVEVRNPGSSVVLDTYTATLDAAGAFSVGTTRTGTFDVAIKASHWLRKAVRNVVFGANGASGVNATLTNGDVNGDNAVSLGDFTALRAAYGSGPGDPNWNPRADLNGDLTVSLGDFTILRANYGLQGD